MYRGRVAERTTITEAVSTWLETTPPTTEMTRRVHQALADFAAGRFFGFADRLREVHTHRRSMFGDSRAVWEVAGLAESSDHAQLDEVARTATHPEKGRLLFHLARVTAPGAALELGTSIGISSAYITLGLESNGGGRVITVDASEARATIASRGWQSLRISGIEQVVGRFDNVLDNILGQLAAPLRFAYVDGNHHREPTLRYFEMILGAIDFGVIVLDDIRWSQGMREAWDEIERSHAATVDLGWVGLALVG